MGVLTSRIHTEWAAKKSSTLRADIRYTPSSAFETFPWPQSDPGQRESIARRAVELLEFRSTLCREHEIGLTALYNAVELQLPFEATGLSERIQAEGRLKLTPDYDVFAWLCERWQTRPTESGWMRPTLYELGSALYDGAPSGKDYRSLRESLDRLAWVRVTIDGYDIEHGEFRDRWVSRDGLMALSRTDSQDPSGLQRPAIKLADWLRQALDEEKVVRVHWRTMRAFHERQALAKRLWLYLAAERWSKMTADSEGTLERPARETVLGVIHPKRGMDRLP